MASRWPATIGATALVVGGIATFVSWPLYAARTAYRLRVWPEVTPDVVDGFETRGAAAFWSGFIGGGLLVVGEQLLLPDEASVPTLAWLSGVVGLGVMSVGMAYAIGGTHCEPQSYAPGARVVRECLAATSDALFGPLLMETALPLLWAPAVYGLRALFAGQPASLTFSPTGVQFRAAF